MKKQDGYVQIYTGNGKGKTTAALGLCLRATGAGMKCYIAQFMKFGKYNEINALYNYSEFIKIEQFGTNDFIYNNPSENDIKLAKKGIKSVKNKILSTSYNLIVLDEVNLAIKYKLIDLFEVIKIIKSKPKSLELILTGRSAPTELIEIADLVTEMKEIKHYYSRGIFAREGIEK